MGYEIDFLPVGEESSGGDAIALRYGNLFGSRDEQTVIIIDGGYANNGEALVEHVTEVYGTDRVDLVVSTHPDQDHITGLKTVISELMADQLWMHLPWMHDVKISEARRQSFKVRGLSQKLQESFSAASELEELAHQSGVEIVEPFQGLKTTDNAFLVLGPSLEYYEKLLLDMEPSMARQLAAIRAVESKSSNLVYESIDYERLTDDVETTARNNSSTICMLTVGGRRLLFTGDAGIPALEHGAGILEAESFFFPGIFNFVQVPHHGSRRNVGPSILNRLLGPKGGPLTDTAFVSAPAKNPEKKHPAKKVTNAFRRRGYTVHPTQGSAITHCYDAPLRAGYVALEPLPFYEWVEEGGES